MLEITMSETSKEFLVSDEAKRTLHDQTIDDDGPGTILRDFDTLLEFVGTEGLRTTGKYYFLPQGKLDSLNGVMSHPVSHQLKRPQQRSFPHLHGLYLLLRASGMGIGVGSPPGGRLMLEPETVDAWRGLNATERYFTLLESWLVQSSVEVLGERCSWSSGGFQSLIDLAWRFGDRRTIVETRRGSVLYNVMNQMTTSLMELFGWVRLEYGEPAQGQGVKISVVERLPLGDAMVNMLYPYHLTDHWPKCYHGEAADPGVLLPLFQPFFPEYQRVLAHKEWAFRDGIYRWHVSLSKAWRQITAPAELSLDELAMTILDAFDFDDEHLYCFELCQTNGRTLRIACPYEDDAAAFTDEVVLGDLEIAVGGTMTMIFDYGDNWHFHLELEKVSPQDKNLDGVRITAKKGKPPAQYEWDDEYE